MRHTFRAPLVIMLHNFIFKVLEKKAHKLEGLATTSLLFVINTRVVHAA